MINLPQKVIHPVKTDWEPPSRKENLSVGLRRFHRWYHQYRVSRFNNQGFGNPTEHQFLKPRISVGSKNYYVRRSLSGEVDNQGSGAITLKDIRIDLDTLSVQPFSYTSYIVSGPFFKIDLRVNVGRAVELISVSTDYLDDLDQVNLQREPFG